MGHFVGSGTRDWTWRESGRLRPALRALNVFGALVRSERRAFHPTELIATAVERSGLDDFGGDSFREGLDALCRSYSSEARFNEVGRLTAVARILHVLSTRLRIVDYLKRNPRVLEQEIRKPWIILGLPRSGTTLLFDLLSLDPRVRCPLDWETEHPVPPASPASRLTDDRIRQRERYLDEVRQIMPPLATMHPVEALSPQECIFLTQYDFRSLAFQLLALAPGYGRWCVNADMGTAYAFHRTILRIWQSAIETPSWALKAPNHLHAIDDLVATYPDARILWLHRDPVSCIPSVASLMLTFQGAMTRSPAPEAVGAHVDWMYGTGLQRAMDHDTRSASPAWCHHLQYTALVADPLAALRAAYAHFGEELSSEHERRAVAWVGQLSRKAPGRHRYGAADFGLTEGGLRERHRAYTERYSVTYEKDRGV